MELKIDLLKDKKKSPDRIGNGILFLLCSGMWFFIWIIDRRKNYISFLQLTNGLLFAFSGFVHIIEGLGVYSFGRLFGKAYILINSESISLKAKIWRKKQLVKWSDVKSIDCNHNKYVIKKADGKKMTLDLSETKNRLVIKVKQTLNQIAKEKNIQINSQKMPAANEQFGASGGAVSYDTEQVT